MTATAGLVAVCAAPALAHDELISTTPVDGASLTQPPHRVTLTFNESIQPVGDALVVTAPDGSRVDTGVATPSGATLSTPLVALTQNGTYTATWRVVSADGHPVTGTFTFTLNTADLATPGTPGPQTPGGTAPALAGSSPNRAGAMAALGVALILGGGTYALKMWARRNRRRARD